MGDIHGFQLKRTNLRALFHAQGQLVQAHRRPLLFYIADVLSAARPFINPDTHEKAFRNAKAMSLVTAAPERLEALVGFQLNAIIADIFEDLESLKDAALGDDEKAVNMTKLINVTYDYVAMARRIQQPDYDDNVAHMSQIDPVIAARFISAYMKHFVCENAPLAHHLDGNPISGAYENLYEIGSANRDYLSILMDDLSEEADLCLRKADNSFYNNGHRPEIYRLFQLYQSCAVFDWRQYEEGAAPKDMPQGAQEEKPQATILPFAAPKAAHG